MQLKWNLRPANKNDWDRISEISTLVASEGLVGDYITDIGPKYLDIGKTMVIETDRIIAYHNIQEVPDNSIYLSGLRVSKEHRRKGIAIELIQGALKEASEKGLLKARALVEPENTSSLSLFSKAGFKIERQVYLYFGAVDTSKLRRMKNWPDIIIDIGHVPSFPYDRIPAKIFSNGECLIAISEKNRWDNKPSFTIIEPVNCPFTPGTSFIVSHKKLDHDRAGSLVPINKFETAFLLEKDLKP